MIAFIFPGQGSQSRGMAKENFEAFKPVQEIFEHASDMLSLDMKKLIFEDPENKLNLTEYTQPALLTVSVAYHKILHINPNYMAGHSLGEYSALVASGCLEFEDALKAVKLRGKYMQAGDQGKMVAAIGSTKDVEGLLDWYKKQNFNHVLEVANYNSPTQTVLSGHKEAVDNIINKKDFNLKLIPLKVSAPFHCSLMMKAKENMTPVIKRMKISNPKVSIITNYQAKEVTDANTIRHHLIEQITSPVLWVQTIILLNKLGVSKFVEVGPGNVLTKLLKKFDNLNYQSFNINSPKDFEVL